jgi:3-dehydro-L-gulonate 2-dehydrogenase
MIITFDTMKEKLLQLFLKYNFTARKAELMAKTYTESTLDGIHSHGINRVPLLIEYIENGSVNIHAEAKKTGSFGMIERWDGHLGPGVINATKCTNRAIELAKKSGLGMVALRNTNHWMRGGTYGRQAADAGCMAILFTNTQPNMPAWGGKHSRIGNNPFIVAIPRSKGHVVLDMAVSQFAFGKINHYKLIGKKLPFPGGFDDNDELSDDPEKITKTERGLPIGYWKGSALSMILDMLTTLLAAGDSTYRISQRPFEYAVSQVYICIDPTVFRDGDLQETLLEEIINYTHDVEPMKAGQRTYYPGEQTLMTRAHNLKHGMDVSEVVWGQVLDLINK